MIATTEGTGLGSSDRETGHMLRLLTSRVETMKQGLDTLAGIDDIPDLEEIASLVTRVDDIEEDLEAIAPLTTRVDDIEEDLEAIGPLTTRVDGVEEALEGLDAIGPLTTRVDDIEEDLEAIGHLTTRMDAVELELDAIGPLTSRMDDVEEALEAIAPLTTRVDDIEEDLEAIGPLATRVDGIEADLAVAGAISTKTTAYTITSNDSVILADATGGAFSVTLPTAVGRSGVRFTIKRINSGSNNVTIATTSSQTIDGETTQILAIQYAAIIVISNNANWYII